MRKIILASSSPRRKDLLEKTGLKFKVIPSNFDEKLNPRLKPRKQAEELSRGKAFAVGEKQIDAIIIAADTFVVYKDEIIGKPKSLAEARRTLNKLSDTSHTVITGFTILDSKTGKAFTESVETTVFMKKISKKELDAYLIKETVLDKAGAYNIDGWGGFFVERFEGDYHNVIGLPLFALANALKRFNIFIFT